MLSKVVSSSETRKDLGLLLVRRSHSKSTFQRLRSVIIHVPFRCLAMTLCLADRTERPGRIAGSCGLLQRRCVQWLAMLGNISVSAPSKEHLNE